MPTHFNAFATPLKKGTNLIEASAGTGKTYSIAMLILRFVVENQFALETLLVVTFTKAATQELRDRIRARLAEAKQLFADPSLTSSDNNLLAWAEGIEDKASAAKSLELALADIDHANIFTIHSFCQGVLRHHALEGGQLFDSALADNVDELQQQIAEDYWRQQVYQRPFREVGLLRANFMTPTALLASVKKLPMNSMVYPQGLVLDDCLAKLINNLPLLTALNTELFAPLTTSISNDPTKFKKAFLTDVETHQQQLSTWLSDDTADFSMSFLHTFSYQGIVTNGLNGTKFKALKSKNVSSEERKDNFLTEQGINTHAIDDLQKNIETIQLAFRLGLHHFLKTEMEKRQQRENIMSFDDLILRLSHALQGEKGTELREVLQQQYCAALIDEFQDTDQEQWHIFSTLFASPAHYLYLIGDPKQAIYKFRGADIYSYLGAQQKADRDYSLDTNWRSHRHVIAACNQLFDVDDPFKIHAIRYQNVHAGKKGDYLLQPERALQKLVLWQLDENPDNKKGYWTSGKAKTAICQHTVHEITKLLTTTPEITINTNTESNTALSPRDIAILVRGNQDALMYQQALQAQGIPAVLNARTSVFSTSEATQLFHLLDAIAEPSNRQKLRYVMTFAWFGMDGKAWYQQTQDERLLDGWLMRFVHYRNQWQQEGVMAMMRQLMHDYSVHQHLAHCTDFERQVTNIYHLIELLQQVALKERLGLLKSLYWLRTAIQESTEKTGDGAELRLESDEDAVKIVTIHSSKGLEYPIIFCPDLWSEGKKTKESIVVCHEDGELIADIGSSKMEQRHEQALLESQAEDLRLLYVAITRAQYRCYITWANVRSNATPNHSALAHLLRQQTGENWDERLRDLAAKKDGKMFSYQCLATDLEPLPPYRVQDNNATLVARTFTGEFKIDWQMSSYSGLAYLSTHDIPEDLSTDKVQETHNLAVEEPNSDTVIEENPLPILPKGAHTGNVVHDLLEHNAFSALAFMANHNDDTDKQNDAAYEHYLATQEKACLRYGLEPTENASLLNTLLQQTVTTALSTDDHHFTLANLAESQCLKEMPFYFAVEQLNTLAINQALHDKEAFQPLAYKTIKGQLTGFIDLVCEYQGRYYVMDYKTNYLPEYSQQHMLQSMTSHNYGLQYWLYSVVLHRYLQQRLANYDFQQHFGGVRYLFVRGMQTSEPMSGVYSYQPDEETIEALAAALVGAYE